MNKSYLSILTALVVLLSVGCSSNKSSTSTPDITLEIDEPVEIEPREYNPSHTRTNDLLHTTLDVSFDWEKQYLNGKANLILTPYFYPTNELVLDAKGFDVHKVAIVENGKKTDLTYEYDDLQIVVNLGKTYTINDTFEVFIDYTAKPNELEAGGSAAITSDKGLYFINPLGEEENKPQQIWTQGETEASSCWFPTIDKPNERCTQELTMTVQDRFVTLSNGLMVNSLKNEDGTRSDTWKLDIPHAPYLFMMGIGEFAVVKDKWRDVEVNYYVEPEYAEYADDIFGNTPEMMEFFSTKLGVDFPWPKYSQIVIRDFVSGAMENTTAVTFLEQIQMTDREMLDGDLEYIVAHELFHHWFGDLVTCESWANLPLNEAFANYSEYLWMEYKYGKAEAEAHRYSELQGYLREAESKREPLIRYYHNDKEDMFDAHSYNKGGLTLHMLRKVVGDDAFFKSLQLYLNDNAYTSVEIHNLRLAFEEVTGQDLNWFFNQYFLGAGHAELSVQYGFDAEESVVSVGIEQLQDLNEFPLYEFPLRIDIHLSNGTVITEEIWLSKKMEWFDFKVPSLPKLVNVDPERILLAQWDDSKVTSEYVYQFKVAKSYREKLEALRKLSANQDDYEPALNALITAMDDDYYGLREFAIKNVSLDNEEKLATIKKKLTALAKNDEEATVRSAAVSKLDAFEDKELVSLFKTTANDRSYAVLSASLLGIFHLDEKDALKMAEMYEKEKNASILTTLSVMYAESGEADKMGFYEAKIDEATGFTKYSLLSDYGDFLSRMDKNTVMSALPTLKDSGLNGNPWWVRYAATSSIWTIVQAYREAQSDAANSNSPLASLDANDLQEVIDAGLAAIEEIREKETNNIAKMRYMQYQ